MKIYGQEELAKLIKALYDKLNNEVDENLANKSDINHTHDDIYAPVSHGTHLTLGTTSSTAYRGDYGNIAYTHSQATHAPSNAQKNSDITKAEIEAKLTGTITSHNHSGVYAPVEHGAHLTIGTGSSNAAAGNHTHNYAGSSSAGGAANSVKTNLIIKLNGGSTEGTDLFTFNGSTAKTINITPSSIGAAASSHGTHLTLGTTSSTAYRGDYGNIAYTHSQAAHAPSNAQKNSDITKAEIEAKLTGTITSHNHSGVYAPVSHGTHLSLGTGASNAAAGNHTHNYAGSSSAGGAATSANKVNTNLVVKLNSGTTEGTDLFTFNGSAAKTINITPSSIGAAAASHGTHLTIGTGASNAAAGNHTHNYAGSSSAGGAANSVKTNLIIKLNGGTTEGTNLFTFNGSTAKTINITPSSIGAAASSHGTHLTLGTTSSTAYRGDYGNIAYTHSQAAHAPSNAQKNSDITKAEIEAKLTGNITSHNHTSLTGITSLTFDANSDDSSIIKITKDSAVSYTDFIMSDDAGSDMWRWRFKAWDSSASTTTAEYNLMTLKATSTTKGQLSVNGNVTADSFTEGGTALSSKYAAKSHGTHLTIGTGASNAAAGNHTHNYAGSSSAGGAANSVKTNLIIKLNGGATEGTNLFTFNGSTAKTINITPANIGAAASSHGTHVTWATSAPKANGTAAVGTVARVAREDHVHPLQTTMNGYSLWSGTKAQYDAITSKSSSTFYFIIE